KNINQKIEKFNKYWFALYFKKNISTVLKEENSLPEHLKAYHGFHNNIKIVFPYIECMTDRKGDDVDQSMENHSKFNYWYQQANNLGYRRESLKFDYCRLHYLKETEPNFACKYKSHYENGA